MVTLCSVTGHQADSWRGNESTCVAVLGDCRDGNQYQHGGEAAGRPKPRLGHRLFVRDAKFLVLMLFSGQFVCGLVGFFCFVVFVMVFGSVRFDRLAGKLIY